VALVVTAIARGEFGAVKATVDDASAASIIATMPHTLD